MISPKSSSACNEEPSLVQLPDPVVLHRVPVSDGEREIISSWLRVPDQVGTVLILHQE